MQSTSYADMVSRIHIELRKSNHKHNTMSQDEEFRLPLWKTGNVRETAKELEMKRILIKAGYFHPVNSGI